jgi:hypothetical protein
VKVIGGSWSKNQIIGLSAVLLTGLCALIAILSMQGMPKFFHWDHVTATAAAMPPSQGNGTLTFTGRVFSESGQPVSGAKVIAAQDQSIGQTIRTDSNGQFQIQLPADTQTLRLVISADGFTNSTIQANVHRTGPEEIVLHSVQSSLNKQVPRAVPATAAPTAPTGTAPAPSVPPNSSGFYNFAPNQGHQNYCAPGSTCDQSTHTNEPQPPPYAHFEQFPVPSDGKGPASPYMNEGSDRFHPGVILNISVDKLFDDPSFDITCSAPCVVVGPEIVHGKNAMGINFATRQTSQDKIHWRVSFEDKLSPGAHIGLAARSVTDNPVTVLNVESTPNPPRQR